MFLKTGVSSVIVSFGLKDRGGLMGQSDISASLGTTNVRLGLRNSLEETDLLAGTFSLEC